MFISSGFAQRVDKTESKVISDYRILTSNESYIEIEFTPDYKGDLDFNNSVSNVSNYGDPDILFRTFPVFFPGTTGNTAEVTDSRYVEIQNVEVLPVPTIKNSKDKEGYIPVFTENQKVYSINKNFPGDLAGINTIGALRNRYIGNLNIYPLQYNPVTKTLKKYSYLKVRVKFGTNPLYLKKSLSGEERSYFNNIAINSPQAENWSTIEFNSVKDNGVINSVLQNGDFYKIEVKETGIYKLDKNLLQNAGINTAGINPKTIKIYGNGGAELPYDNMKFAPDDLLENRIYVEGENDGQFNDNDFILFYGRSPNDWEYDSINKTYRHVINHYSKVNYYWITYGGADGLRMQIQNSPNIQGLNPVSKFKDRLYEEPEVNNLGSTGLLWVSQRISVNESFSFNKELKGYIGGSNVNLRFRFGNGSFFPETWRLEDLNSGFIMNQYVSQIYDGFSHINLVNMNENINGVNYPLTPGKNSINFRASLRSQDGNSPNVAGYYDFMEVLYDRSFSADNNLLRFNSPDTNGTMEFQINNFNTQDIKIFDVSDQTNVNLINPVSYSNGTVKFQSEINSGDPKEFYAMGSANYFSPVSISGRVPNQNLKGELAQGSSFFIISPKEFMSASNTLKAQREKPGQNYLKTTVIDIEEIYNEFSNGMQDPLAVRNFLKYAFNNFEERPVYVAFMGDGSYDYKNIYNLYNGAVKNWILPVEKNSLYSNDVDSYCSDDFLVEINESYEAPGGSSVSDFATGRIPVNTLEEANNYIEKVISYENPANFDKWRQVATYIADDGWTTEQANGQEGSLHTDQCEDVSQNHSPDYIKKQKIYIVNYPSEITPQGRRKPEVNKDIVKSWNEGRLVINYTGHGSTDLWAHEHIFERQVSIPQLTNKDKYPFITIASCDLARWDDPYNLSAAEQLVSIKDKGAIAISAAVRPVYSIPNAIYNNRLYDNLFLTDTLGLRLRMGKAIFNVKQQLHLDNDLKFSYLGDPTLRLGVPQYRTKVDSINSTSGDSLFEMKSLQKVKISGSILRTDSTFWSDYNGTIDLQIHDVDKNITYVDFGYTFNWKTLGGIIYNGKTNVTNGNWQIEFVVPRDISYSPGRGKIFSYFKNNMSDGIGYSNNFIMNGIDTNAVPDSTGPNVSIYMGSRNFRSGDLVNQNSRLIADFSDENGLNLTGTIGHKIEAIINEDQNNKIDLTPFYQSSNSYQNGSVEYDLQNLSDGHYKIEVKAWDTYNNFNSSFIEFDVRNNDQLALENVYNYPNPMKDQTSFIFEHNLDETLNATINIYTVTGRLIKELNKSNIRDKFVSLDWDGRDNDGDYIANGTYIYKLILNSEDGNYTKTTTGKLAKLK
ncbi:MAG TPA: type IX secretion system sortase PorU [Ignavibacteria bacterium]|nr:type IX secretion system sortase PorU [Ignavibacteria bacterium]